MSIAHDFENGRHNKDTQIKLVSTHIMNIAIS